LGADRIAVDALLHKDLSVVYGLSQKLGAQALIASLPLSTERNNVVWFDYVSRASPPISREIIELIRSGIISEILVSDWKHEGKPNQFDHRLIDKFPIKPSSIIAFGGISTPEQMLSLLKNNNVVAVAIGNFLSYREHAIQSYKELLYSMPLRHASYESNSLIANTDV
jgi:cyclase